MLLEKGRSLDKPEKTLIIVFEVVGLRMQPCVAASAASSDAIDVWMSLDVAVVQCNSGASIPP